VPRHRVPFAGETKSVLPMAGYTRHRSGLSAVSGDPFERDMVDFVIRWSRYGGGSSADIFEQFGLVEPEFFRRVLVLINAPGLCLGIDRSVINQVRRTCLARLSTWWRTGSVG
jgi:hypothetical protein